MGKFDGRWRSSVRANLGAGAQASKASISSQSSVRNNAILLTNVEALAAAVMKQVGKAPEGVPLAAKELLHIGSRAAVDQTLSRLVRRGSLIRVGRGLYVRPVEGRFGVRPPEPATVV